MEYLSSLQKKKIWKPNNNLKYRLGRLTSMQIQKYMYILIRSLNFRVRPRQETNWNWFFKLHLYCGAWKICIISSEKYICKLDFIFKIKIEFEKIDKVGMYLCKYIYVQFYVIIMQFSKTIYEKSFETFCSQNYSGENLQFSKFFKKFTTILATK